MNKTLTYEFDLDIEIKFNSLLKHTLKPVGKKPMKSSFLFFSNNTSFIEELEKRISSIKPLGIDDILKLMADLSITKHKSLANNEDIDNYIEVGNESDGEYVAFVHPGIRSFSALDKLNKNCLAVTIFSDIKMYDISKAKEELDTFKNEIESLSDSSKEVLSTLICRVKDNPEIYEDLKELHRLLDDGELNRKISATYKL